MSPRRMTWFGIFFFALAPLGLMGCAGGNEGSDEVVRDTLSERQKDSLLGSLPVPGAGAIQNALDASDAARARAEAHDTIG